VRNRGRQGEGPRWRRFGGSVGWLRPGRNGWWRRRYFGAERDLLWFIEDTGKTAEKESEQQQRDYASEPEPQRSDHAVAGETRDGFARVRGHQPIKSRREITIFIARII
jgi:hypothetical protein